MRLLADECCDLLLVNSLREDGHDVLFVAEIMRGASDDDIIEYAYTQKRILITEDKDFGELVHRLKKPVVGLILLRFDIRDRQLKIPRIRELIASHEGRLLGAFVVLETQKIRFRLL